MFSKDDIHKLASLARIELSQTEEESLAGDIDTILAYVGQVGALEVSKEEPQVGRVYNVLREDDTPHETGEYTEALMAEAPEVKEGYVRVKRIL